jgi:flavin reductase (DIM6/NTAB) family NADH-FMN oxidoreductase RutF
MYYDVERNDHGLPHDPFKSCVVPRPIGWISTLSRAGIANIAPFSFFNAAGLNPPHVMFASGHQHVEGGATDTLINIEETGEFVVNMATWELREQMNTTSSEVERSVDEFTLAGLEKAPSVQVKPPRVKAAPIHLECTYFRTFNLPANDPKQPNLIVIGQVVGIHISDDVLTDGMIDMTKFKPIARLGYQDYSVTDNIFTMPFPYARR